MGQSNAELIEVFGNKLRLRVCGICLRGEEILLVRHDSLTPTGEFWSPPGGGMHYGESAEETLLREFKEETGLDISIQRFLFVHEFLSPPLHAIELFYEVKILGGEMRLGHDPEMQHQILRDIQFVPYHRILQADPVLYHNCLRLVQNAQDLLRLSGYYQFKG